MVLRNRELHARNDDDSLWSMASNQSKSKLLKSFSTPSCKFSSVYLKALHHPPHKAQSFSRNDCHPLLKHVNTILTHFITAMIQYQTLSPTCLVSQLSAQILCLTDVPYTLRIHLIILMSAWQVVCSFLTGHVSLHLYRSRCTINILLFKQSNV